MSATTEQTTVWNIDGVHSLVEISAKHMMFTTVKGRITGLKGTITTHGTDPAQSSVEAELDASSITTGNEMRDNHMRSPDFLDVANHPTITFKSAHVEPQGSDRMRVTGDLTVRGVTKQITFDATFNGQGKNPRGVEVAGFTAETSISRKEFGLNWNVALETGGFLLSDTFKVLVEIQATKAE
ncbi:MAG: YceI family protein [Thermomicrobiales bacterium]